MKGLLSKCLFTVLVAPVESSTVSELRDCDGSGVCRKSVLWASRDELGQANTPTPHSEDNTWHSTVGDYRPDVTDVLFHYRYCGPDLSNPWPTCADPAPDLPGYPGVCPDEFETIRLKDKTNTRVFASSFDECDNSSCELGCNQIPETAALAYHDGGTVCVKGRGHEGVTCLKVGTVKDDDQMGDHFLTPTTEVQYYATVYDGQDETSTDNGGDSGAVNKNALTLLNVRVAFIGTGILLVSQGNFL